MKTHKPLSTSKNDRTGKTLQNEQAHTGDHKNWSRRDFLTNSGLFAAGASFMLGSSSLKAFAPNGMLKALGALESDKTLVIVRLKGGNDGLNTIIPRGNEFYYNIRPTIAIQENELIPLTDEYGLNAAMNGLTSLWDEGEMAVLQSVGYPDPDYSHFRSSDIWASASDTEEYVTTGWVGRHLDREYPAYNIAPPNAPAGLQIGVRTNALFRGGDASMALAISNPTEFYRIAQTGQLYDTSLLPKNCYGQEATFMRDIANNSFRYSEAIKEAFDASSTDVNYPEAGELGEQLQIVSRLIKGRLGTKVYLVDIGGFDTHAEQRLDGYHESLLADIGNSIRAFTQDLKGEADVWENTLIMTISEFGRTVHENGSLGTDHGTAAPQFIFGANTNISGGIKGEHANIDNIPEYGDMEHTTDFRSMYYSVLKDWFCMENQLADAIMGRNFPLIDDLLPNCDPPKGSNDTAVLFGHNPNPSKPQQRLIKYAILKKGFVRLQLLDLAGKPKATLINTTQAEGSYTFPFYPQEYHLKPGHYIYRLDTGGKTYSRRISLLF
ncbi:MAG: DUF1501 domain-containing protein [Chitinophagales bacterium]